MTDVGAENDLQLGSEGDQLLGERQRVDGVVGFTAEVEASREEVTDVLLAFDSAGTEVKVTYDDGRTETRTIDVKHWLAGKRTATLELGAGVKKVVIDPRRMTLLDIDRRNNVWEGDGE